MGMFYDFVYKFGYLILGVLSLLVWGALFARKKSLRREMLVLSVVAAVFGPLSEYWYFKDYWQPHILVQFPVGGFEDLIFGFAIGGIAAVIYEVVFVNWICFCEKKKLKKEWFLLVFGLILAGVLIGLNTFLGVNSIYASSLGMIIAGAVMLLFRPDLWLNAVGSGVLVALVMFVIYIIPLSLFTEVHQVLAQIWKLYGTSQGILLFGHVPLTEIVWGFSWGFVGGPIYEFVVGARTLTLRKR
ncbi:MAG: hypothetical protein BMS9Abin34_100 [Patescibacteria group bacterium]|nr:MAG: hypothetical protein BMS9Abin34_100 [Patescibacteria group bacterium]